MPVEISESLARVTVDESDLLDARGVPTLEAESIAAFLRTVDFTPLFDAGLGVQEVSESRMKGRMKTDVKLLGTSLTLKKGQLVHLTPATNQPDKRQFFARPHNGKWHGGINSREDSILIHPHDVDVIEGLGVQEAQLDETLANWLKNPETGSYHRDNYSIHKNAGAGRYSLFYDGGNLRPVWGLKDIPPTIHLGTFDTARAAAQASYKHRLKSKMESIDGAEAVNFIDERDLLGMFRMHLREEFPRNTLAEQTILRSFADLMEGSLDADYRTMQLIQEVVKRARIYRRRPHSANYRNWRGNESLDETMRVYDQGTHYRVTVSPQHMREFNRRWPASGLSDQGHSFTFDKNNGDLVDMHHPGSEDGHALLALSHDAGNHGARKLKLSARCMRESDEFDLEGQLVEATGREGDIVYGVSQHGSRGGYPYYGGTKYQAVRGTKHGRLYWKAVGHYGDSRYGRGGPSAKHLRDLEAIAKSEGKRFYGRFGYRNANAPSHGRRVEPDAADDAFQQVSKHESIGTEITFPGLSVDEAWPKARRYNLKPNVRKRISVRTGPVPMRIESGEDEYEGPWFGYQKESIQESVPTGAALATQLCLVGVRLHLTTGNSSLATPNTTELRT